MHSNFNYTKGIVKKISFLVFFLFITNILFSQDILRGDDLTLARVDRLTDADILRYQDQLKANGLTQLQGEQIALSKGFPSAELAKLRLRIARLNGTDVTKSDKTVNDQNDQSNQNNQLSENIQINRKIFGADQFSTASTTFQPTDKIATPLNYQLGPDDELQISIHGLQEASFNLKVSPEGAIDIPNVGEVQVSGYTIENARESIRSRMSSIYTSLRSGSSQLSINLGKIRSIRVTVLGSTKPGTYTLSSLSTVFNALYLSGGPALNGSYREIELLRNNKIAKKIDLYNFLTSGSMEDDERLREGDIIRIPVYKKRVEIEGEIKRPGIFEILQNETLNDVIKYASGFTDSAYKASIKVIQLTEKERRVQDITSAEFSQYKPSTGDYFEVSKILSRFINRVSIEGAVLRPGLFELSDNLTLAQLIKKSEGLREDAYTKRGLLIRLQENLEPESIPFDVNSVLDNITDIKLKREDRVIISSIFELKDPFQVYVQGEVRKPGQYQYVQNLSLKDLIFEAGGFTDAAYPQRIEIASVIRRDTLTAQDIRLSETVNINDVSDLSLTTNNHILRAGDIVTVRRLPGYLELKSVSAVGQVQFPGLYILSTRAERISDLLKRAGGVSPEAYPAGAYLKRKNVKDMSTDVDAVKVEKIQEQLKDSSGYITAAVNRDYDQIPLDLTKIIREPGNIEDLILKADDQLFIPKNDEEIKITGEVLFPTQAPFKNSKSLKNYIKDAGGFTDNARQKRVYVLYPNGKAASTSHFLFFRNYPAINPGSDIIVPKYVERKNNRRSAAETIALAGSLASLVYIIIAITKL